MTEKIDHLTPGNAVTWSGEELVELLSVLSSPARMRILAALWRAQGKVHVSRLAREIGLSRPLTHMNLKRLEAVGLIEGHLEVSPEGRALRFYEVSNFTINLTPAVIDAAAQTLIDEDSEEIHDSDEKEE